MHLPWKKARVSRISRLMADLHPHKPCSSMVVETGFPTSLVDLFVKNCDRLKKPTKKKKKHHHHHHHLDQVIEELVISDPVTLSSSRDLTAAEPFYVNKFKRQDNFDGHHNIIDGFEILGGEGPNHSSNQSEKGCGGDSGVVVDVDTGSNKDERCVLFAVLKMFVVMILALSTKKLALGITLSAFFLLFLEYIGKHLLCFLQPCSSVRVVLQPLIQLPFVFLTHMRDLWVCNFSRLKSCLWVHKKAKEGLIIEGEDAAGGGGGGDDDDLLDSLELNSSGEEIQVAEARFDAVARLEAYQYETVVDLLAWGRRWGRLDMLVDKDENEDLIHQEEHHHSHKIRRKIIKKLVPKKLLAMKKARKWKVREDVSSEVSSHYGDDKLCGIEETEEQDNSGDKENSALWQLLEEEKEGKCEEEKKEETENKTSDSSMELQTKSEMIVFEKIGNRGSSLLLLIVLAGLVGGRILALGLTVVSCLIIQLVWRGPRGCVNKTSASMSS